MLPGIRLLQSVGCRDVNARCCEYSAGNFAFAEDGELNVIFCDECISEPQTIVHDGYIKCSALALSRDGSLILAGGPDSSLKLIKLSEPKMCLAITLPASQDKDVRESIECIVNDGGWNFAVAAGRNVHILNSYGKVIRTLGPLSAPVLDLRWHRRHQDGSATSLCCLVAVTAKECYIWPLHESNLDASAKEPIVIPCSRQEEQEKESIIRPTSEKTTSSPFSLAAVSPNSPFLALTCNNACEVNCWDLDTLLTATPETIKELDQLSPPLLNLSVYDNPLQCITYDTSGRYLATSDGPECTIWDMSHISELKEAAVHDANSIICCGHDSNSRITCLAFQPDESGGALLATVSSTGKLALFNSREFRPGGVCGPYSTTQVDIYGRNEENEEKGEAGTCGSQAGNVENFNNDDNGDLGEVKLFWISENRLLVVIPGGDIVFYSVDDTDSVIINKEESATTVFSAIPGGLFESSAVASPNTNGGGGEAETTLQPRMLQRLSIGENVNTSSSFDQACVEYISSPLTPPRGPDDLDSTNGVTIGGAGEEEEEVIGEAIVYEGSSGAGVSSGEGGKKESQAMVRPTPIRTQPKMKPPPPPLESLPVAQTAAESHTGRRKGNTTATPSAAINANAPRCTNISIPPGGLLEQRIQQLRDAPPIERGDQRHHELTGWGLGVSGGCPSIPWIMTPAPGTGNMSVSPSSGTMQMPTMAMNMTVPVHMAGGDMVGGTMIGGAVQYPQQQQSVFMYPSGSGIGPAMPAGYGHPAGVMMGTSPPTMHQYAQYQSAYPHYALPGQQQHGYQHPMMMMMVPMQQPRAGGGVGVGTAGGVPMQMMTSMPHQQAVRPPPPTAPYPGSPRGGAAHPQLSSPRSPAGRSQQPPRQQNRGGGGSAAVAVQSPRQGWQSATAAAIMHQQQMQASQQWASVAPGYMAYQHGGTSPGASCSGGGGGAGIPPPGVVSPRSGTNSYTNNQLPLPAVHLRQQQQQQQPPPPPSPPGSCGGPAAAPKAKTISEKEAEKINNGNVSSPSKQSLQKRRSKGGSSSGKSSSIEAAAAAATASVPAITDTPTAASVSTPAERESEDINRNFSEETASSIETHELNNINGATAAASAGGSGDFSNSSSFTPSPRQSDNHRHPSKPVSTSCGANTPPLSPVAAAPPPAPTTTPPRGALAPSSPVQKHEASSIMYIGNLPQSVDDSTLYWTCSHFGPVSHVQIIRDKATQSSRGYGFVTFAHPAYATVAMQNMNGQVMYGPFGGQKIRAAPTYKKCMEGGVGV